MVASNFQEWLNLNFETKNTIQGYSTYMNHFFSLFPEFNQETVNAYLIKRTEEGVKKSTLNKIIYTLKVYARFLKIELEFPKIKKLDKRIKDYMTIEELETKVLPMIDLIFNDYQTYDIILRFMFFTGMRVEEIITLDKTNIDFEKGIIKVINTKGKVDREIFSIDEKFFNDLKQYVSLKKENKVFDLSYYQVWYNMKKLETEIQWGKKIHPHFFRISFAKHCVRIGINDSIIQKLLGHADLATTLLYCEPDRDMIHEACNRVKRKELING